MIGPTFPLKIIEEDGEVGPSITAIVGLQFIKY